MLLQIRSVKGHLMFTWELCWISFFGWILKKKKKGALTHSVILSKRHIKKAQIFCHRQPTVLLTGYPREPSRRSSRWWTPSREFWSAWSGRLPFQTVCHTPCRPVRPPLPSPAIRRTERRGTLAPSRPASSCTRVSCWHRGIRRTAGDQRLSLCGWWSGGGTARRRRWSRRHTADTADRRPPPLLAGAARCAPGTARGPLRRSRRGSSGTQTRGGRWGRRRSASSSLDQLHLWALRPAPSSKSPNYCPVLRNCRPRRRRRPATTGKRGQLQLTP